MYYYSSVGINQEHSSTLFSKSSISKAKPPFRTSGSCGGRDSPVTLPSQKLPRGSFRKRRQRPESNAARICVVKRVWGFWLWDPKTWWVATLQLINPRPPNTQPYYGSKTLSSKLAPLGTNKKATNHGHKKITPSTCLKLQIRWKP